MSALESLKERLHEVTVLGSSASVLGWDQQTQMPPGGAPIRAEQLSLLSRLSHEMATSDEVGRLLSGAEAETAAADADSDDAAFVRVARRDYDHATKLPSSLVAEIARTSTLAHEEWARARAASDFGRFAPWLEKVVDLNRQVADHLGYKKERYDALIDQYEPGMTTDDVRAMFAAIKPDLIALVRAIAAKGPDAVDDSVIKRDYDEDRQLAFGRQVVVAIGYDFEKGRQDRAVHPFCTSFSNGDVRITTRFERNFLPAALFGSIHETGHALYEQGVADRYDGNALQGGVSLGIHESQSRLWENLVGRSRPFWDHFYGPLQSIFPEALGDVDRETFYRAINRVEPSLIRVEADEVTYNLHVLLRFELEVEMIEGRLSVGDAPAAWNAKMEEYLGLTPPDDARGILQDVHWSGGTIGYFPTYTLGNIVSVQLFEAADKALGGSLAGSIARGEFAPLLGWLRENVHQWGRKYWPQDLVRRATGTPIDPQPYLAYLKAKFADVYGL